ncbi:MAG: DMT family transporter [Chromatiales bacterium]|nr:DMT family transporter [Chromatiales bacterium]
MSVPAAYLGIILIWATTPLAIKWSNEGTGFLLAISARMSVGFFICLLLLWLLRIPMRWDRDALVTYLAAGLGMFAALLSVYWGAQYIPSGLISVLYGLSPILMGLFAALWLQERFFTPWKLAGVLIALGGLVVIFVPRSDLGTFWMLGLGGVLLSVLVHSISAVWVKRQAAHLHPMVINCGALSLAVPLYLLCWLLFGDETPAQLPERSMGAILYLAIFGTVVGFNLYFYVLKRVSAMAVGVITLITPVLALLLGQGLNGELIGDHVWYGTVAILLGLALFMWGHLWRTARVSAR